MSEHPILRVNGKDHPDPIGPHVPQDTRYLVNYVIDKPGHPVDIRSTTVVIIAGYTTFSDIPKIVAIPNGVDADHVVIYAVTMLSPI